MKIHELNPQDFFLFQDHRGDWRGFRKSDAVSAWLVTRTGRTLYGGVATFHRDAEVAVYA